MTGKGHTWVGLATAIATYKFTKDLEFTGYIAAISYVLGATAPDWMEIRVKSGDGFKTMIKHRTITHWLLAWVVLFYISFSVAKGELFSDINFNPYLIEILLGFSMGGIIHLLTDLPNPKGIPIFLPFGNQRFSLNLWKSGKNEILLTTVGLLLALWYVDIVSFNFSAIAALA